MCKFGQWSPLIVYLYVLGNSQRSVLIRSSSDTSVLIQEMKLMIIYFWRLVEWSLADLASGHMIPRGRYSAISQWRLLWWKISNVNEAPEVHVLLFMGRRWSPTPNGRWWYCWQLMKMPSADELTIKTWYRDGGLRNQILGPLLADIHVLICTNKPWLWY